MKIFFLLKVRLLVTHVLFILSSFIAIAFSCVLKGVYVYANNLLFMLFGKQPAGINQPKYYHNHIYTVTTLQNHAPIKTNGAGSNPASSFLTIQNPFHHI